MRTDQAFVLLLILLLPLTGCIDTIGEVDAQDSSEPSEVAETYTHEVVFVDNGSTVTITVNDTILQILDRSVFHEGRMVSGVFAQLEVDCGSEFSETVKVESEDFVPTLPGQECNVTFSDWGDNRPSSYVILRHPAIRVS